MPEEMPATMQGRQALAAWRERVASLRAPPCGMAHERIPRDTDGRPMRHALSESGFARAGLCPAAERGVHLGCSHTMARHVLRDALAGLNDPRDAPLLDDLRDLENAISLLDHRRYEAELRHARAPDAAAEAEIDMLVAEHRRCSERALALRDAVLARLDAALAAAGG